MSLLGKNNLRFVNTDIWTIICDIFAIAYSLPALPSPYPNLNKKYSAGRIERLETTTTTIYFSVMAAGLCVINDQILV